LLLALLALYLLRLRQVSARLRLQLGERIGERERIARELHDTLLQSVQGLIWRIDGLSRRLPVEEPVRRDLRQALDDAEAVLVEGRDRVAALRDTANGETLDRQIRQLAERLRGSQQTALEVQVEGSPRALQPLPQDEVLQIAREALANALRHAGAAHISITLSYHPKTFELVVRDDGRGIPPEALAGKSGHWGLHGMRERARNIGAQLEVRNAQPGTELRLQAPAAVYERRGDTGG
jgi:signal transduction histidine kinase